MPRGFEILPAESIARLRAYHFDRRLTPDARRDRIEAVFDELSPSILERLPLAPGLARLPQVRRLPTVASNDFRLLLGFPSAVSRFSKRSHDQLEGTNGEDASYDRAPSPRAPTHRRAADRRFDGCVVGARCC